MWLFSGLLCLTWGNSLSLVKDDPWVEQAGGITWHKKKPTLWKSTFCFSGQPIRVFQWPIPIFKEQEGWWLIYNATCCIPVRSRFACDDKRRNVWYPGDIIICGRQGATIKMRETQNIQEKWDVSYSESLIV